MSIFIEVSSKIMIEHFISKQQSIEIPKILLAVEKPLVFLSPTKKDTQMVVQAIKSTIIFSALPP